MQKLTIFVGDNDIALSLTAKKFDSSAVLATRCNWRSLGPVATAYTSMADFASDIDEFIDFLSGATCIVYSPPGHWSDNKSTVNFLTPTDSTKGLTEHVLLTLKSKVPVENINAVVDSDWINQAVDRTDDPTLWIVGCSISHGEAVEADERYGHLLAKALNMPVRFITMPASSVIWAASQILINDIRSNDIVIWGITSCYRVPYYERTKVHHVNVGNYTKQPSSVQKTLNFDFVMSDHTVIQNLNNIAMVVNFCHKIGSKLIMFNVFDDPILLRFLHNEKSFYYYQHKINKNFKNSKIDTQSHSSQFTSYLDTGSDNNHPGPLTHQAYFKFLLGIVNSQ